MDKEILELLTSHGTLVSPETMNYISTKDEPKHYIRDVMKTFHEVPLFLTVDLLKTAEETMHKAGYATIEDNQDNGGQLMEMPQSHFDAPQGSSSLSAPPVTVFSNDRESSTLFPDQPTATRLPEIVSKPIAPPKGRLASEYDGEVTILRDVTGNSTCEGIMKDFSKYFQARFETLRKILLSQRREVMGAGTIDRVRTAQGPLKFIGLVSNIRVTKQGHKLLELEDETDSISILINNTSPLISQDYVNDEVVCVIGKLGKNDLVYTEDIIRPDVPIARKQNKSELPLVCAFISDIHVGSTTFLHKTWAKFISWLNGDYSISGKEELLNRLKYIVVAGDIVDGIGIYPNQESELEIPDIYAQYEDLALKFQEIPEHIKLIVQPGNHDAVRPAEPQPTFPAEITKLFSNDIQFVGNPCYFTLNSVEVLAYHGRSMDDFVMQIPSVTYNTPIQIMKEMLVRRHLAPIYGLKTPIAPEHQDYLLIDKVPDIFVTGHIHKTALDVYRDITLINASAWQSQTSYQRMMNFNPDPGKIILADLQTRKLDILSFY